MRELRDKVVLITGAGRGVGRKLAMAFAYKGAIVAANDLTPINLDVTIELIKADGGRVKEYIFDVAKQMPVQSMVDHVLTDWGRIDVLVNNAGVQPCVPLLDMDEWDWRRTIDVNLNGSFFTTQQVGRAMRQQGGGVMINIAPLMGRKKLTEDCVAYKTSMMGLIGLTKEAALELGKYKISLNAVCPKWTETRKPEIATPINNKLSESLHLLGNQRKSVHKWLDRPREVSEVVLFLCTEVASSISGQVIHSYFGDDLVGTE